MDDMAVEKDSDVDKPRNLAESATAEKGKIANIVELLYKIPCCAIIGITGYFYIGLRCQAPNKRTKSKRRCE